MNRNKQIFLIILAIALLLPLVLMSSCQINIGNSESPTTGNTTATPENTPSSDGDPTEGGDETLPETTAPESESTKPVTTMPAPKIDYEKVYTPIINEWQTAFHNFIKEDYKSGMLSFSFYGGYDPTSKAYYALHDIDNNGILELLLKEESSFEDTIAYIFTIKDNKPINIFGYDGDSLIEVPWSRAGSSSILANGLINSLAGDYSIYKIADDGYTVLKIASSEPYNFPDMASLADADWRYYINSTQVTYEFYAQYLSDQGFNLTGEKTFAAFDWKNIE